MVYASERLLAKMEENESGLESGFTGDSAESQRGSHDGLELDGFKVLLDLATKNNYLVQEGIVLFSIDGYNTKSGQSQQMQYNTKKQSKLDADTCKRHRCVFSSACMLGKCFPALVACFPAFGTGCMFSRAWHRLHVFPRLASAQSIFLFQSKKCEHWKHRKSVVPGHACV